MIKKTYVLFLFFISLTGCLTISEGEMYEFSSIEEDEVVPIEAVVEIPEVELFVSAPLGTQIDEEILETEDVRIPEEDIPELEMVAEKKEIPHMMETPDEIVVNEVSSEAVSKDIPSSIPVIEEKILRNEEVPQEVISYAPTENEVIISREKSSSAGSDFIIELDSEGWIYNSTDLDSVKMKNREFTGESTKFIFSINDPGSYQLTFFLQNPSSGKSEEVEYTISVESLNDRDNQVIVIEPDLENETGVGQNEIQAEIISAVEEENIPELVASFGLLVSEDAPVESSVLSDAFKLLEQQGGYDRYLVDLAENAYQLYPYDNKSAELLYKAALAVEKPGPGQDIEKALSLFKLVREHFPISIYCDKSEERIRYLERHFMKIY